MNVEPHRHCTSCGAVVPMEKTPTIGLRTVQCEDCDQKLAKVLGADPVLEELFNALMQDSDG